MSTGMILWNVLALSLAAGVIILWVIALLQISKSYLDATAKAIWVLIVVIAPFLGALAWFFIGSSQAPPLPKR